MGARKRLANAYRKWNAYDGSDGKRLERLTQAAFPDPPPRFLTLRAAK